MSGEIDIGSFSQSNRGPCRPGAPRLMTRDRIYLANIASAILLPLGATSLYVTRTDELVPHARTVSAAQLR